MLGAPGHITDDVDCLNAIDRCVIAEKMHLVMTQEANESPKIIAAKVRVEGLSKSIGCALIQQALRGSKVKENMESNASMNKRQFDGHEENSMEHVNPIMKCQPFLTLNQTCKGFNKAK
jgi:hypothetical protein